MNKMGNVQSSTTKNMVNIANSFINNTTNSSSTDSSAISSNRQTFDILFGPNSDVKGCDINATQSITSNQVLKTTSLFQTETEIKNELSNMIDQIATTSQDAVAEFLSFSGNAQISVQDLTTSIKNDIQNNITNENATVCTAIADNLQQGKITILGKYTCGPDGKINLTQQLLNDQVSECISKVFFQAIADNTIVNDIVQKAETDQAAKTIGPLSAIFGSLGAIIGLVVIIIVCIGGFILYKKFAGSPQKKPVVVTKPGTTTTAPVVSKAPVVPARVESAGKK